MPTFPNAKRQSLETTDLGALISLEDNGGNVMIGFRVAVARDRDVPAPGFVQLARQENGRIGARSVAVDPRRRGVNHGTGWTLHVRVADWDPDQPVNYALEHAGLLLLEETDPQQPRALGMAVGARGGCGHLNLDTWVLEGRVVHTNFSTASDWSISLPGVGPDVQWPLG